MVIANPSYDVLNEAGSDAEQRRFIKEIRASAEFAFALQGKLNLYRLFIEKGSHLIKPLGLLTYIVPSTIIADKSAGGIRKLLSEKSVLQFMIEIPEKTRVFENVTQALCIFQFQKRSAREPFLLSIGLSSKELPPPDSVSVSGEDVEGISGEHLVIPLVLDSSEYAILKKMHSHAIPLGQVVTMSQGDINLTFQRKYLSSLPTESLLVRGDHISRFKVNLDTRNPDRGGSSWSGTCVTLEPRKQRHSRVG